MRRNFQGYTDDAAAVLIPIGPSSIGQFREGFVQNHVPSDQWAARITQGELPLNRALAVGDEDRLRASGEGREARVLPTFRPRRSLFPNSWGTGPYAILILYLMIKLSISEAIHIRYPSSCS